MVFFIDNIIDIISLFSYINLLQENNFNLYQLYSSFISLLYLFSFIHLLIIVSVKNKSINKWLQRVALPPVKYYKGTDIRLHTKVSTGGTSTIHRLHIILYDNVRDFKQPNMNRFFLSRHHSLSLILWDITVSNLSKDVITVFNSIDNVLVPCDQQRILFSLPNL